MDMINIMINFKYVNHWVMFPYLLKTGLHVCENSIIEYFMAILRRKNKMVLTPIDTMGLLSVFHNNNLYRKEDSGKTSALS